MSISNPGKDEKTSPIRIIKLSIHPPLYPASNPNTLPIIREPLTTTAVVTIKVVRAESAIVNAGANSGILIRDDDHYQASFAAGEGSHGEWAARTAGTHGNSIGVEICATATGYEQELGASYRVNGAGAVGDTTVTIDDVDASGNAFNVGDLISFFSDSGHDTPIDDFNEYEVTAINTSSNVLTIRLKDDPNGAGLQNTISSGTNIRRRWRFYDLFDAAPGTSSFATQNGRGTSDELHIVVYDRQGLISGFDVDSNGNRTNGVLETFANLSKNNTSFVKKQIALINNSESSSLQLIEEVNLLNFFDNTLLVFQKIE